MSRWRESRYFQLVVSQARDFAVWPIGRRPPAGWRVVPFAGTIQACGRQVAELTGVSRAGDAARSLATDVSLVGLLRKAAGEQPDAPALCVGDLRLSYRRLWESIDDAADRLAAAGAGPGRRVAVVGERAEDLVAAALAVLAAGATCVLCVGSRPDAAVREAQPELVLTPAGAAAPDGWPVVRQRWRSVTGAFWQAHGRTGPAIGAPPGEESGPSLVVPLADGAVGVVWRGAQLSWLSGACGLPPSAHGDRLSVPASAGPLVGVVAATRALLTGAELLLPAAQAPGTGGWGDDTAGPARWSLHIDRSTGPAERTELFGFAETSMMAAVAPEGEVLTPLPQHRWHVLDPGFGPVPTGEVGELFLGGPMLAVGYLDRPDLTLARFLPDPLGGPDGSRMFRTGCRARCLPGGGFVLVDGED
ncbi:AMP-binding protein [Micromonospora sp. WMMD956]|uniref:AMP-binding protein n=1 Tax=Micromonospora sp. WMMD956 TaxID=3016108 RepID=UPI0024163953|nr:AMP-binding protein [Micromonospora sp. WMMD956]MDG4817589.1 AMP-binding protein [Micromonospora sp. WMMD956]